MESSDHKSWKIAIKEEIQSSVNQKAFNNVALLKTEQV